MTHPRLVRFGSREEWLEARRLGVGGSDVAAILGVSRWRTPLTVWASKVGVDEEPEDAPSYSQRRGNHMEAFIAGEIEQEIDGLRVSKLFGSAEPVMAIHPDNPLMRYSPDALLVERDGGVVLGEWKSNLRARSGEWQDDIPEDVRCQVQHGMYVLDLPHCYVAVDLGHEMRWKREERDHEYASVVVPALVRWWEKYVVGRETPPPTARDQDRSVLDAMYPAPDSEKEVGLDVELLDAARRFDEIGLTLASLEAERKAIQNRVIAALGDAERGVLVDGSGWRRTKVRRIDPPRPEERVTEYMQLRRVKASRRS